MLKEQTSAAVETKQVVAVQINVGYVLAILIVSASFVLDTALLAIIIPLTR